MTARRQSLAGILQKALSIRDRGKRRAYMAEVCRGRPKVLAEVESLLAENDRSENVLGVPSTILGRVLSHYEVLQRLGHGGMGEVYKARDKHLGRLVAIKALPKWAARDAAAQERLINEAKTASSLNHPNIVTIIEVLSIKGRKYLVMEYIEGRPLPELIPTTGLTVKQTLPLALEIAGALSATHLAGIIHGDLKPSNIMVRPDGHAKLLDFGIARRTSDANTSEEFGTQLYMAPEKEVSARSEVFAFGLILFEILCGKHPFIGSPRGGYRRTSLVIRPKVPMALARIVSRCLQKSPVERFASMTEVFDEIRAVAEARNPASVPASLERPRREISEQMRLVRNQLPRIGYQSLNDSLRAFDEIVQALKNDPSSNVRDAVSAAMRLLILTTPDGFTGVSRTSRAVRAMAMELVVLATRRRLIQVFKKHDLEQLDLFQMNLSACDLTGLSLADAFLTESSFKGSQLTGVSFAGAYIRNVNFDKADITGADFSDADWFNALGLKPEQLRAVKRGTLMECPVDFEALYAFVDNHYGIPFRTWPNNVQTDLMKAWHNCIRAGGLRDYVSGLRRKSR